MVVEENRRPIGQRSRGWAKWLTRVLVKSGLTPNFISFTSIVFAALAGACFYASGITASVGDRIMLLIGAALFCQLRLLANMMDGMVAVEAKKGGPGGPVWNELPDRFADIFILVGAGYGVAALGYFDATLGWAAAAAAVMTAYVREVVKSAGAPADFSGPMAKPHRMFWMTMAALASIFDPWIGPGVASILDWAHFNAAGTGVFITFALWFVLLGSILTIFLRTARGLKFLRTRTWLPKTDVPQFFRMNLEVGDLAAAQSFYEALLAAKGRGQPGQRFYINAGPVAFQVVASATPQTAAKALYFTTTEIDAVHARALSLNALSDELVHGLRGGDISVKPWGERSFYANDPWGNPLCFVDAATTYAG